MHKVLVGVKALIRKGDRFLLLKQEVQGEVLFDIPGGKMEYGESPEEALRRELTEEIGMEVDIGRLAGVHWFFRTADGDQTVCITYECTPKTEEIDTSKNPGDDNIISYEWVTPEQFLQDESATCNPSFKEMIREWSNSL